MEPPDDDHNWLNSASYRQIKKHALNLGISPELLAVTHGKQAVLDLLVREAGLTIRGRKSSHLMLLYPRIRALLLGTDSPCSVLSLMRGHTHLLQRICMCALHWWESEWRKQITWGADGKGFTKYVATVAPYVRFPESRGINVNMMPFVLGSIDSLPPELHEYWPLVQACPIRGAELGQVGYITIMESDVAVGETQRRAGLHVDGFSIQSPQECTTVWHRWGGWGGGHRSAETEYIGGIYMCNNVDKSACTWNASISETGANGDVEHLRELLGPGVPMQLNTLYWLTDATPHETLPMCEATHRQFFRVVTAGVSVWYEKHSTKNPLGVVPGRGVQIVNTSKFEQLDT